MASTETRMARSQDPAVVVRDAVGHEAGALGADEFTDAELNPPRAQLSPRNTSSTDATPDKTNFKKFVEANTSSTDATPAQQTQHQSKPKYHVKVTVSEQGESKDLEEHNTNHDSKVSEQGESKGQTSPSIISVIGVEEPKPTCSTKVKISICYCSFLVVAVVAVIVVMVTGTGNDTNGQIPAWKSLYELDDSCFQNVQERAIETWYPMVLNELVIRRQTFTPAANGMVADVTFELAAPNGKRAAACEDFLRVVLMSGNEAVVVPRITVYPSGIYHVSATLWRTQQRLWNVFVTLEHQTFNIDFWTERLDASNIDGCQWSASKQFPVQSKGGGFHVRPDIKPMFALDPFAASQPMGVPSAAWTSMCTRTQLIAANNGHRSTQVSVAHEFSWGPPECKLQPASTEHVLHVLRNKWVLMIGDSTMEELFYGILSYALGLDPDIGFPMGYGNFEDSNMHPTLEAAANNSDFVAESRACGAIMCRSNYYDSRKGALPYGMRLTFLWNADWRPGGAHVGLNSFKFEKFREHLQSFLDEGPDVVVFNSGLHDIRALYTLNEYSEKLKVAWDFLQRKPLPHYIWKSTAPLFKGAECEGYNFLGNAGLKILNQVANRIASERGADIFDHWAVCYLAGTDDGDGVHFRPGLSYHHSLALLLRQIELGPK